MLLKSGYRHVYISRQFAIRHGFIPTDAAPGHYGYGGLVKYAFLVKGIVDITDIRGLIQHREVADHCRQNQDDAQCLPL